MKTTSSYRDAFSVVEVLVIIVVVVIIVALGYVFLTKKPATTTANTTTTTSASQPTNDKTEATSIKNDLNAVDVDSSVNTSTIDEAL